MISEMYPPLIFDLIKIILGALFACFLVISIGVFGTWSDHLKLNTPGWPRWGYYLSLLLFCYILGSLIVSAVEFLLIVNK